MEREKINMRPEILAPVGNREALEAAIAAGCDAVYFGLPVFGARAYAKNFSLEETEEIIKKCHLLNIKVYITMNTVIFEDEMEEAYALAKRLHEMDVDALIIQDLGLLHLLHHRLPDLVLHASTQLSVSKPNMIEKLKQLGVQRVVLARECTMDEIRACVETGMEIEVFIHGAICICYSGQCYFSSVRYDRSGNRGMCAQPCRMPYTLYQDNALVGKELYYLSPKDLSLIDQVKELEEMGVVSLKIEGRMKSAAYVYESVMQTKSVLDNKFRSKQDIEDLMVTFNRGYTKGHAYKMSGYDLMNPQSCNHQGINIGKVIGKRNGRLVLQLKHELNQNDGIRIGKDLGCHVNYLYDKKGKLTSHIPAGSVCEIKGPKQAKVGDTILKTTSVLVNEKVEKRIKETNRQIQLNASIVCDGVGSPLICKIYDQNIKVEVISKDVASQAQNRALDEVTIKKQFNKTKDSFASFTSINVDIPSNIFFTISSINELRRNALEMFKSKKLKKRPIKEIDYVYKPPVSKTDRNIYEVMTPDKKMDTKDLWVCEMDQSKGNITSLKGDVLPHLGKTQIIDGMNVTNSWAIAALLEMGYQQVVLSDENKLENISNIMNSFKERYGFDAPVLVCIYQHRRLMTMNHCVINTALKDGKRKNCSLCHQHEFKLKGKDKKSVICLGDRDCHLRLYDEILSDDIAQIASLKTMGIKNFKAVFLNESLREIQSVINRIQSLKA